MARPIGATPALEGKEARDFLKRMEEPPTEKEKRFKKKLEEAAKERIVPF